MAYQFTADWVTDHEDNWRKWFGHWTDRPVHLLEIGSFEGRSAIWWLDNVLTHPDSTITCVDPFKRNNCGMLFDANIAQRVDRHKVRKHAEQARWVLPWLTEGKYNLIYIDGDHTAPAVLSDAVLSFPLLAPNGYMLFDDCKLTKTTLLDRGKIPGPGPAANAFAACYRHCVQLCHLDRQMLLQRVFTSA